MKAARLPKIFNPPFLSLIILILISITAPTLTHGNLIDEIMEFDIDEMYMLKGDLEIVRVRDLTRLSIVDPDIADIQDATVDMIELIAKDEGQTVLFIWDAQGKRSVVVHVFKQNLDLVKARIKKLLKIADINELNVETNEREGKVVVSGEIPEYKEDKLEIIMAMFGEDTIDLVTGELTNELIQIDMQITELNTTLTKSLGIDWGTTAATGSASTAANGTISLNYPETLPSFDGSIGDFLKIGDFERTTALLATVKALLQEGKGRILSQPSLVVVSGEEAKFLVGGEIPIRTTTTSEGSTQENVEFKEFGVGMTITPTIIKDKINIEMTVDVSDIDRANAVGDDVAFTTRNASTILSLDDAQTIVLAGLIRQTKSETINKVPFLGDIPVLGLLFRSKSTPTPDEDQEIVISLTPTLLSSKKARAARKKGDYSQIKSVSSTKQRGYQTQPYSRPLPYYAGVPQGMEDYTKSIQRKISRSLVYPQEARDYGWEGTVKLGMIILNDGTLAFASIRESSGYDVFDEVALKTAKEAAPYLGFPADSTLQELNVTIPIVYSFDNY